MPAGDAAEALGGDRETSSAGASNS